MPPMPASPWWRSAAAGGTRERPADTGLRLQPPPGCADGGRAGDLPMAGGRARARAEIIDQFLKVRIGEQGEGGMRRDADRPLFKDVVEGAVAHKVELEQTLTGALAQDWTWERVDRLVRAILLAGAYELIHRKDVPPKVAINEYVEIAHALLRPGRAELRQLGARSRGAPVAFRRVREIAHAPSAHRRVRAHSPLLRAAGQELSRRRWAAERQCFPAVRSAPRPRRQDRHGGRGRALPGRREARAGGGQGAARLPVRSRGGRRRALHLPALARRCRRRGASAGSRALRAAWPPISAATASC